MSWKRKVFENFKLYAVTDLRSDAPAELAKIEAAYRGGADIVQLRSKTLSDLQLYRMGLKIRKIADRYKKLFFVNDRLDLALACGADGLHLGQDDLPSETVRRIAVQAGKKLLLGKSTHRISQSLAAVKEHVDYIGVGPVFATPTKPGYVPAGLNFVREAAKRIKIPFVAIGGIDRDNIHEVLSAGARRIAVVRAIFNERKPENAAREIRRAIEG